MFPESREIANIPFWAGAQVIWLQYNWVHLLVNSLENTRSFNGRQETLKKSSGRGFHAVTLEEWEKQSWLICMVRAWHPLKENSTLSRTCCTCESSNFIWPGKCNQLSGKSNWLNSDKLITKCWFTQTQMLPWCNLLWQELQSLEPKDGYKILLKTLGICYKRAF